jgi:hypothetical protein
VRRHIRAISLLLTKIIITTMIVTAITIGIKSINSDQFAYAHNFVPNIAASFLTRINQIKVQTQLVENNIPLNLLLAKQHAQIASELFDNNTRNDLYYNAEGNNGVAQKISDEIPLALSNLQKAVMNISTASSSSSPSNQPEEQQQPQQQTTAAITSNSVIKQIKEIVNNINDILDKAVSVRINKNDLTNPTVYALVIADITEKAYNDYSYAYGIKPVNFSGPSSSYSSYMMNNSGTGIGVGMMAMGGSDNASSNTTIINNTTKSHLTMTENNINNTVANITAYQQAQGLVSKAQEIFDTNLKPASSTTTKSSLPSTNTSSISSSSSSTNTDNNTANSIADISKIENNLIHLKNAIDNKTSITDVIKIVYGDIHPALLASYNLLVRYAVWTDKSTNIKIQFSYSPESPTIDDTIQLQFNIQDLQSGSNLKDLIAYVTVTNDPLYKFNKIPVTDGNFSVRCPFLDAGIHQVILKVDSKGYSLALASFNISVSGGG